MITKLTILPPLFKRMLGSYAKFYAYTSETLRPRMRPTAGTGFYWDRFFPHHRSLLRDDGLFDIACKTAFQKLQKMSQTNYYELDAAQLWQLGLQEPITAHAKNEPHKKKKLDEGKVRIVYGYAVTDMIVHHFVSHFKQEADFDNPRNPCQAGQDMTTPRYARKLFKTFAGMNIASNDVKNFDCTVTTNDLALQLQIMLWRTEAEVDSDPWNVIVNLYSFLPKKLLVMPDGSLYKQIKDAGMPSGAKETLSVNSETRVLWCDFGVAVGDDCVEKWSREIALRYEELGIKITDVREIHVDSDGLSSGLIDFCSRFYASCGCTWSSNPFKAALRFVLNHMGDLDSEQQLLQNLQDIRGTDEFEGAIELYKQAYPLEQFDVLTEILRGRTRPRPDLSPHCRGLCDNGAKEEASEGPQG